MDRSKLRSPPSLSGGGKLSPPRSNALLDSAGLHRKCSSLNSDETIHWTLSSWATQHLTGRWRKSRLSNAHELGAISQSSTYHLHPSFTSVLQCMSFKKLHIVGDFDFHQACFFHSLSFPFVISTLPLVDTLPACSLISTTSSSNGLNTQDYELQQHPRI